MTYRHKVVLTMLVMIPLSASIVWRWYRHLRRHGNVELGMTSDINGAMLQHYQPSRLQLRLMRLGLRRFRWFRRWLGGVWRRTRGTWRHHLELTPMELMAMFPMVALAEIAATLPTKTAAATFGVGRDYELWSLPPGELPVARAIRMGAAAAGDDSTGEDASRRTSDGMPFAGPGKPAPR